eukprot:1367591-Prymnesium_polylepis.1
MTPHTLTRCLVGCAGEHTQIGDRITHIEPRTCGELLPLAALIEVGDGEGRDGVGPQLAAVCVGERRCELLDRQGAQLPCAHPERRGSAVVQLRARAEGAAARRVSESDERRAGIPAEPGARAS